MIPEIAIQYILDKSIELIQLDWDAVAIDEDSEKETLLYEALMSEVGVRYNNNEVISRYKSDMLGFAKEVFISRAYPNRIDRRKLTTVMMFSPDMMQKPCIHITSPSEILIRRAITDEFSVQGDATKYGASFESTYTLLITSPNKNEVMVIYSVIMAMLMSVIDTFLVGAKFDDYEISGHELRLQNPQAMAEGIFAKAINIKSQRYSEIRTPKAVHERINSIIIKEQCINKKEE